MGECKVIEEKVLTDNINGSVFSQDIFNFIEDTELRNRAFANYAGAVLAKRYFDSIDENVDIDSGLHNIPQVLQELDISDVYWNNTYIDIRLCFNEEELLIPSEHFTNGIIPSVYMFIKVNEDLSEASVLGFTEAGNIEQVEIKPGFYSAKKEDLKDFEEIKLNIVPNTDSYAIDDFELYNYSPDKDNNLFYLKLINSYEGRIKLNKIIKAQNVFKLVSISDSEQEFPAQELTFATSEEQDMSSDFNNFTVVTPNLQIEPDDDTAEFNEAEVLQEETSAEQEQIIPDTIESEVVEDKTIETFYNNDDMNDNEEFVDEGFDIESIRKAQRRPKQLLIAGIIASLVIFAGVFGFIKFKSGSNELPDVMPNQADINNSGTLPGQEAMPNETISQKDELNKMTEEGNAMAIPSIENNLDASILVSNLKIDWEVPTSYASNTSITRYLIKMGKIIQLNLKAELLLLSKPPITNRITVELKFNNDLNKFDVVGIINSSGEKSVDDIILQTIKKSLKVKLNANTDSFKKLEGNPILVIKL